MSRNYGQYCGLARALDVVGDRWSLLIVRQLLVAPARYRELLDGLPGVATNLLAGRLRDLEAAGVVERRLADDGGAVTYALTSWGAQLREPIEGLIRWSSPLMVHGPGDDVFRTDWLVVALPALLGGTAAGRRALTVGIAVDGRMVQLRATRTGITVGPHDGRELDAVVQADAAIVLGLAAGMLALDDVLPLVDIDGDEAAVRAVFGADGRAKASGKGTVAQ
ncbi:MULTISPECIES: helix-turn-helix domain-containing protein [unclassified Mycobacterium]|uniref:winged helix-turn-helix transcriptional regulator n=1 Tax=unclassified Mycobacterium TaxID=2642494 RepID=UPI00073FADD6|nr:MULTISPECIES: helix-turn-helix domain-containing protein [unclassified Mycobacterium]KUH81001.1 HxlR family transcriptional regulator [Mycobacterium sp. GA-1999]KUH84012.1 HxlR family transcriptional regulator [Mycobacterium sp. IS-1556]KUH89877.1 HxlR family transcriptional regulator [Mycobacterium sp. GA-0227b]